MKSSISCLSKKLICIPNRQMYEISRKISLVIIAHPLSRHISCNIYGYWRKVKSGYSNHFQCRDFLLCQRFFSAHRRVWSNEGWGLQLIWPSVVGHKIDMTLPPKRMRFSALKAGNCHAWTMQRNRANNTIRRYIRRQRDAMSTRLLWLKEYTLSTEHQAALSLVNVKYIRSRSRCIIGH